ncbi:hypothetical protein [uncultured Mediterranean phage uvMED]|nr:hypothetical protein [uncultured Mediterranean phage uvMED]BAR37789.1 hypothetical protein [uncultured Mediterranean phage uvMED]BAR37938.1 hypothetical protein [uncultured Mediterranean phage uvMED]|tara:strand:- start:804 stop:1013 length:210 start_codon:yes stop_codon:yes gene_type:complete
MELIIYNDGVYHLLEVTKEMTASLKIFSQVDCFNLCDVLRLHLSTYSDSLNAHVMHDGSGDLFGCICSN